MTQDIHITGAGHTKFGRLPDSLEDLIVESAREAMEEAQTAPSQIDAVFLGHFNSGLVKDGFASSLIPTSASRRPRAARTPAPRARPRSMPASTRSWRARPGPSWWWGPRR